jgi:hypothetical protein
MTTSQSAIAPAADGRAADRRGERRDADVDIGGEAAIAADLGAAGGLWRSRLEVQVREAPRSGFYDGPGAT